MKPAPVAACHISRKSNHRAMRKGYLARRADGSRVKLLFERF